MSAGRTAEASESLEAGAPACPGLFSSETNPNPEPAPGSGPAGARTPESKAVPCPTNLKHGLTGPFRVLEFESQSDFDAAHEALITEHQPATPTESELIRRMAEHAWLSRRARLLQDKALTEGDEKRFSLYMRYEATNDRGFRACLNDLFRLRKEQRAIERQFESQNRETSAEGVCGPMCARQASSAQGVCGPLCAAQATIRLANARALHLEVDSAIRGAVHAPIPGYSAIPVQQVKHLFQQAAAA